MDQNIIFKTALVIIFAVFMVSFSGCTGTEEAVKTTEPPASEPYTTVTVDDIKESLKGKGPVTAGLDIDATTFFTESIYYYGLENIDGPDGTNLYGDDPLSNPDFIYKVNNDFAGQYIPKEGAKEVINMHLERGDRVIFITKKTSSEDERISEYITSVFGIEDPVLIFTNESTKTPYINEEGVSVYYGDSDGDITDCNDADKCTPYRFKRNMLTVDEYDSDYNPGQYGESVVENSEY